MKILKLKKEDISTKHLPYNTSGTYFLLDLNFEVVYVGKATNVISRLIQHKTTKDFKYVIVIETKDASDAHKIETIYLNINLPLLNNICPQYNDIPLWALRNQINESEINVIDALQDSLIDFKSDIRRDIEKLFFKYQKHES